MKRSYFGNIFAAYGFELQFRSFKWWLLYACMLAFAVPLSGQTIINVTSDPAAPIDANQTSGSPVTVNIFVATTSPGVGITKTDGGDLTINFTGSGAIDAVDQGINLITTTGDLAITSISSADPVIVSGSEGVRVLGVGGMFRNSASIRSQSEDAIVIFGDVDGSFANMGALLSGSDGIRLNRLVRGDFTNSGQIGTSSQRVGDAGIVVLENITGDFLNDTGGDIFSSSHGINLFSRVNGDFTNHASIDSQNGNAMRIDDLRGSFTNTGDLQAGLQGIRIAGTVGSSGPATSFTNSGQIGTAARRVGTNGIIIVGGRITHNFINDTGGDIFSNNQGIYFLFSNMDGDFTNHASIDSLSSNAIEFNNTDVDGSFTNTGDLMANLDGINIGGTVGNGFTNSGQIGSSAQHVGEEGIEITGTVTGNFLNDTGGDIFSTSHGILLSNTGTSLTGNFINRAAVQSQDDDALLILGDVDGSFTNTGNLTAGNAFGDNGIRISGTVGNGFTNSGQIGTSAQSVGGDGIQLNDTLTGNFLNDAGGDIFSSDNGIAFLSGVTGNFTNHASIDVRDFIPIVISSGGIGGTFTNTGDLRTQSIFSSDGISITGGVNAIAMNPTGFINSGQIGDASQRVSGEGIDVVDTIFGDFVNDTGGDIFSTTQGIRLFLITGGDFTNRASIDSQTVEGIDISGTLDGNFNNSGTVLGNTLGVELAGLSGSFINSGTITGTGDDGVEITVAGVRTFENLAGGTITGSGRSVEIIGDGMNFTNAGTLNGDVVLGAAASGGNAGNVQNIITLNSGGVINGLLDVGTHTSTVVTLTGTSNALLSTEVTGGINSGATTHTVNGSLAKDGTGTWTIDQNLTVGSGTTVNGGTLLIAGGSTLTSDVIVGGGTLGGIGNIGGNVTINAGGMLAPGTSPGILNITGNFTLNAGSTSNFELNGITPGSGHDQVVVTGTAALAGTLNLTPGFGPNDGDEFSIIDAALITGDFDAVINTLGNALEFTTAIIGGNTYVVTAVQGSFNNSAFTGGDPDLMAIALSLDSISSDPNLSPLIDALNGLPGTSLEDALEQINPDELAALSGFSFANTRNAIMRLGNRLRAIRHGAGGGIDTSGFSLFDESGQFRSSSLLADVSAVAPAGLQLMEPAVYADPRFGIFVSGSGTFGDYDGDQNGAGYDYDAASVLIGADYRITDTAAVGIYSGYDRTDANLGNNGGQAGADTARFGVTGTWWMPQEFSTKHEIDGMLYAEANAGGAHHWYETDRNGFGGVASGDTTATELSAGGALGYEFKKGNLRFGPEVSLNYTHLWTEGFTETGSLAPLTIADGTRDSLYSTVGARASYQFRISNFEFNPFLHTGWRHEYLDTQGAATGRFAVGVGSAFTVNGSSQARDSIVAGFGINAILNDWLSTELNYFGEGSADTETHSINGSVTARF
ncbi:MAG: autotransporter domain-containing protein [Verrucomicrobiota bacterium]